MGGGASYGVFMTDPAACAHVLPAVDGGRFRKVLGHFPTGVTVVTALTTEPGGSGGAPGITRPVGMAVGSFTSVSLSPPLIGFLPATTSTSWPLIRAAGRFCVNILSDQQRDLALRFARRGVDRFATTSWRPAPHSGAPLLAGVTAWIDCTLEDVSVAGDHHFVLARVDDLGATDRRPLVFFQSDFHTLDP